MADASLVYHLIFPIRCARFGPHVIGGQFSRYRVIEIDYSAPNLGMLAH